MLKVLGYTNSTGSRFYRMVPEFRWLQEQGHEVRLYPFEKTVNKEDVQWADVIVFEMIWSPFLFKLCRKYNPKVKIVLECDDLVQSVPKLHYAYKDTIGKKGLKLKIDVFKSLRNIDALIVTNNFLKKQYGWLTKKSFVFNNYCDMAHWVRPYVKNQSDKIRLLWAGSTSHTGDLLFIQPIIKEILDKYKDSVEFVYIGHGGLNANDPYAKFIYGEDIFSDLPANRESLIAVPALVWPHILSTIRADIAIAPLEENTFNRAKSQCKYLEYSINKIPAVYSGWFYKNVKHGFTGLTADTKEEWVKAISHLIDSSREREEIGELAYQDVIKNHNIDNHLNKWQDFIENL
jgi:glycosyltransferase involved in cell wall biosynthesis